MRRLVRLAVLRLPKGCPAGFAAALPRRITAFIVILLGGLIVVVVAIGGTTFALYWVFGRMGQGKNGGEALLRRGPASGYSASDHQGYPARAYGAAPVQGHGITPIPGYGAQPGQMIPVPTAPGLPKAAKVGLIIAGVGVFAAVVVAGGAIAVNFMGVGLGDAGGGACARAVRCCKVIGGQVESCDNLGKIGMPESGCQSTLDGCEQVAASQGKSCK